MNCTNMVCIHFIIAAAISLISTSACTALLIMDKFKNSGISSFCSSVISANVAFWAKPPKIYKSANESATL